MCLFYAKSLLCTIVEKYTASCTYVCVISSVFPNNVFEEKGRYSFIHILC